MNATKVADLNISKLIVELAVLFPDSKNKERQYMIDAAKPEANTVWVASAQYAWQDVSWGWVSDEAAKRYSKNSYSARLYPCSQGGCLIQESYSIGD
jgi:hypothetical protein